MWNKKLYPCFYRRSHVLEISSEYYKDYAYCHAADDNCGASYGSIDVQHYKVQAIYSDGKLSAIYHHAGGDRTDFREYVQYEHWSGEPDP